MTCRCVDTAYDSIGFSNTRSDTEPNPDHRELGYVSPDSLTDPFRLQYSEDHVIGPFTLEP